MYSAMYSTNFPVLFKNEIFFEVFHHMLDGWLAFLEKEKEAEKHFAPRNCNKL